MGYVCEEYLGIEAVRQEQVGIVAGLAVASVLGIGLSKAQDLARISQTGRCTIAS